jgi:hypothetical protein
MTDTPSVCEFCAADNELRTELQERGEKVGTCSVCGRNGGRSLPADDRRVKAIVRALIRLHFSEWEYNMHLGGESLQGLVFESRAIFSLDANASADEFENVFLEIEDSWYPKTSDEISLGGGYWDGIFLEGVRGRLSAAVGSAVSRSLSQNWFEVEPAVRTLVDSLRPDISTVIRQGAEYWRARIGVEERLRRRHVDPLAKRGFHYRPYAGNKIGRPPVPLASEGRFNRSRVAFLYLASDAATAVAELRPHPGHLVSVAKFRLERDLRIADFTRTDIRDFLSDERLEVLRTILSFADVLNVPVQPEQRHLYSVTQLVSDAIRAEGFDGLAYRSTLGDGSNLTCFPDDAFSFVGDSETACEVVSLRYELEDMPVAPSKADPKAFEKDEDSPLATLLHGLRRANRSS